MSKTAIVIALAVIALVGIFLFMGRQDGKLPAVSSAQAEQELREAEAEGARLYAQEAFERAQEAVRAAGDDPARAGEAARLAREARLEAQRNLEQGSTYVVRPGDNLWDLSQSEFGFRNPWVWPLIWDANRDQISNPHRIEVGWTLTIPGRQYSPEDVKSSRAVIAEAEKLRGNAAN